MPSRWDKIATAIAVTLGAIAVVIFLFWVLGWILFGPAGFPWLRGSI